MAKTENDKGFYFRGLTDDLKKRARIQAIQEGIGTPGLIIKAIEEYLDRHAKQG